MEKRQPTTKPVGTGCLADRGQDTGLHAMSSDGAGTRLTSQQLVGSSLLAPRKRSGSCLYVSAREGHTEPWQGGIGKLGLGQIGRTGLEREWPDDGMRRSGVHLDCAS